MKCHISFDEFSFSKKIAFFEGNETDGYFVLKPTSEGIERVKLGVGETIPDDAWFLTLHPEMWKALVESMTEKGFMAKKEYQLEGMVEALQAHLEDMRTLVFKDKEG